MNARAVALLCALVGLASLQSCTAAGAVSVSTGRIEQLRLGFALDPEGSVSAGCASSSFALHDPIHFSMQVADATLGSTIHVAVRDIATHRIAWKEERPVASGRSRHTFELGRKLAPGRYLAETTLGATFHSREFNVHDRRATTLTR